MLGRNALLIESIKTKDLVLPVPYTQRRACAK
jgi:hypothetical protein